MKIQNNPPEIKESWHTADSDCLKEELYENLLKPSASLAFIILVSILNFLNIYSDFFDDKIDENCKDEDKKIVLDVAIVLTMLLVIHALLRPFIIHVAKASFSKSISNFILFSQKASNAENHRLIESDLVKIVVNQKKRLILSQGLMELSLSFVYHVINFISNVYFFFYVNSCELDNTKTSQKIYVAFELYVSMLYMGVLGQKFFRHKLLFKILNNCCCERSSVHLRPSHLRILNHDIFHCFSMALSFKKLFRVALCQNNFRSSYDTYFVVNINYENGSSPRLMYAHKKILARKNIELFVEHYNCLFVEKSNLFPKSKFDFVFSLTPKFKEFINYFLAASVKNKVFITAGFVQHFFDSPEKFLHMHEKIKSNFKDIYFQAKKLFSGSTFSRYLEELKMIESVCFQNLYDQDAHVSKEIPNVNNNFLLLVDNQALGETHKPTIFRTKESSKNQNKSFDKHSKEKTKTVKNDFFELFSINDKADHQIDYVYLGNYKYAMLYGETLDSVIKQHIVGAMHKGLIPPATPMQGITWDLSLHCYKIKLLGQLGDVRLLSSKIISSRVDPRNKCIVFDGKNIITNAHKVLLRQAKH